MLELNKDNFIINIREGTITHKDDEYVHIILKKLAIPDYEKNNLPFLALINPSKENVGDYFDSLLCNVPKDYKKDFEEKKGIITSYFLANPIIYIDEKSFARLQKGDLFVKCMLYHELGHYIHSDEFYDEENRGSVLQNSCVSKKELDADEFAYGVCGIDYYYSLVDSMSKCYELAKNKLFDDKYLTPAIELKIRVDCLAEKIKRDI